MAVERILVADDEPDVLNVAVRALAQDGYEVRGVSSGAAAVEEARHWPYDMLIADVKMPGMSGLRAYRLVKEIAPETIGLIVTGYGTMEMAIEAVRLGVNAFILKPFGPDELCAAVARALEGRRLARENARLRALLPVHQLTQALVATTDLDSLAARVAELATREADADSALLLLVDSETGVLYPAASYGQAPPAGALLRIGEGIAGWVAKTVEPLTLQGTLVDGGRSAGFAETASAVCLPLVAKGRAVGVLLLAKGAGSVPFSEADNELLSILAEGAAVAVENARLFTDLQRAYARLAELDHRKNEFISLAAHELRSPPPTRPSMTAMVALGMVRNASHMRWKSLSTSVGGAPTGSIWMSVTSKWAMKKSGTAERSTTTRTAGSAPRRSAIFTSAGYSCRSNKLIGGWSIVTVATPSTIWRVSGSLTPVREAPSSCAPPHRGWRRTRRR